MIKFVLLRPARCRVGRQIPVGSRVPYRLSLSIGMKRSFHSETARVTRCVFVLPRNGVAMMRIARLRSTDCVLGSATHRCKRCNRSYDDPFHGTPPAPPAPLFTP